MGPVIRRFTFLPGAGAPPHLAHSTEIHWLGAGRAMPEVSAHVPSIHMAWNGAHIVGVDGRSLKLEDDVLLVLNAGHTLTGRGRHDAGACLLSVYFAPELLAEALRELGSDRRELVCGRLRSDSVCLLQHLRESDHAIASVMRYIAHHVCEGIDDALWYEEQIGFLLGRLLTNEAALAGSIQGMTRTKAWKRRETFVRLSRVTDLIHSAYEQPLTMSELAEAAHWSPFHMMREFKASLGVSPFEFLQRRRTQAAARLLSSTDLSAAEIAERVGFRQRSTMMRRLRRMHGLGARALRLLSPGNEQSAQGLRHRKPIAASFSVNSATSISSVR